MDERELQNQLKAYQRANNWMGIVDLLKDACRPGDWGWNDGAALSTLGFAYTQLNALREAEAIYQRWIEVEPDRAQPFYCLGYVYYLERNWQQAIRWFEEALRLFPDYLVVHYRLAYAHQALHTPQKALPHLDRVQQIYQANTDENWQRRNRKTLVKAQFLQARLCNRLGRYQKARHLLQNLLNGGGEKYLRLMDLYYELGKAYAGEGQHTRALEVLERAAEMARPPQPYIYDQIGRVLQACSQHAQALEYFNRALKIRRQPFILVNRARTNLALGQPALAIRDLHEALKRDKKGKHKIYLELGKIYLEQKKLTEAEHYLRQAIQFKQKTYHADYAEAHYGLVFVHLERGDREAARRALEKALDVNPNLEWDEQLIEVLGMNRAATGPPVNF
ncbi:MAG: tetratricopeptide repeat protein [Calditrichaeota bacterium]|nr:MAG: tetratricopeptide repeat protein [Calditrichota bacterium]